MSGSGQPSSLAREAGVTRNSARVDPAPRHVKRLETLVEEVESSA